MITIVTTPETTRMQDDFLRALNADHELNMLIAMQEIDAADDQDVLDECLVLYEDWRAMYALNVVRAVAAALQQKIQSIN